MTSKEQFLKRLPNDIGGLAGAQIQRVEHTLLPWEKRCHALADVIDYSKLISTEEKRRGVEELGTDLIGKLSYYERWIAAFVHIFFQKGILTPSELASKMEEVEARCHYDKVGDTVESTHR
jgi:Nitrile hydratase beta subunit